MHVQRKSLKGQLILNCSDLNVFDEQRWDCFVLALQTIITLILLFCEH